jgi:IS5 family transposase
MIPRLLDPGNEHDYVWADLAYSGQYFVELMRLGGFESLIRKEGGHNLTR